MKFRRLNSTIFVLFIFFINIITVNGFFETQPKEDFILSDESRKIRISALVVLAIILLMYTAYSQIYLGTVEGYIKNATGNFVQDAEVNVTVQGCSGNACSE